MLFRSSGPPGSQWLYSSSRAGCSYALRYVYKHSTFNASPNLSSLQFYLKESPRFLLKMEKPELASANLCFLRKLPSDHPYIESELSATVVQINREREVTDGHKGGKVAKYFRGMWHEVSQKGIRNRL